MRTSDESEELGPSVRFLDRASGKIEVSGLASPFSVLRYVLAPLHELYGRGSGQRSPDPTSEALAPLLELAGPLRTSAERDALAAYIIRKLHNAWNPK